MLDRPRGLAARTRAGRRSRSSTPLHDLALGRLGRSARKDEFVVRFQQTCGPVMAKGVEDTAFYRWHPARRAVRGRRRPDSAPARACRPSTVGDPPAGTWPHRHDDAVHPRHQAIGGRAAAACGALRAGGRVGRGVRAASWPRRLRPKASTGSPCRPLRSPTWSGRTSSEPGRSPSTGWRRTSRRRCARPSRRRPGRRSTRPTSRPSRTGWPGCSTTRPSRTRSATFVARLEPFARANSLSAKLIQLTMPGVPDIYQGTEAIDRSLVDPDNRRPVDFAARSRPAGRDGSARASTPRRCNWLATALRVRRDHPDAFVGTYTALSAGGSAADHVVAFQRGSTVITVATRLAANLDSDGGWADTSLTPPDRRVARRAERAHVRRRRTPRRPAERPAGRRCSPWL